MNICVFCSSYYQTAEKYLAVAEKVGRGIARRGHTLVFGGFDQGSMGAVARGAADEGGKVIGILPGTPQQYSTRKVFECDEVIYGEDLGDRKQKMWGCSDAFITLPGSFGTLDEFYNMVSYIKLNDLHRPCALLDVDGFYAPLMQLDANMMEAGFMSVEQSHIYERFDDVESLLDYIES